MIIIYLGTLIMLIGNFLAFFQKNILKKIHYIGAGDTSGAILIMIGLLTKNYEISKIISTILILIVGLPASSYFISISIIRKEKKLW